MQILHETKHLFVNDKLEICWNLPTHALLVGKAKTLPDAIRFCERAEKYPDNIARFIGAIQPSTPN